MALLEETYRKIDPDGVVNMAFNDTEFKEALENKNGLMMKEKNGKNPLDV